MSTYSDHDQRLLDQQTGEEMDRQAQRRERREARDTITTAPIPQASNLVPFLREVERQLDRYREALIEAQDGLGDQTDPDDVRTRIYLALRQSEYTGDRLRAEIARLATSAETPAEQKCRICHRAYVGEYCTDCWIPRHPKTSCRTPSIDKPPQLITASASTDGGAPSSRTPSSSVECPKCRTQLAFEGDVCGLCQ